MWTKKYVIFFIVQFLELSFLSYSRQEDISCLNKSLIFLNIIHEIFMLNHTIYIIVIIFIT